jgi:hypothetical protein
MRIRTGKRARWIAAAAVAAIGAGCWTAPPARVRTPLPEDADPGLPGLDLGAPWTGWDDAAEPALVFNDVSQWKAEGAELWELRRTAPAGARVVGRLRWASDGLVRLTPSSERWLREPFDSIELWAGWIPGEAPAGEDAGVEVDLIVTDAAGEDHGWSLGRLPARPRGRLHHRLPHRFLETAAFPFRLRELRFRAVGATPPDLWLGHIALYAEHRVPIVTAWRGGTAAYQTPWLHVLHGETPTWGLQDRLPPAGPSGAAPAVELTEEGGGAWRWTCTRGDRAWGYRFHARTGWTHGVDLLERAGEGGWRALARWRGFGLEDAPLTVLRRDGERLHLARADGWRAVVDCARGVWSMEIQHDGRAGLDLAAGVIDVPGGMRVLDLPLYNEGGAGPLIALLREGDPERPPLAVTVYFDPRFSSASELRFLEWSPEHPPSAARAIYRAGPDGRAPPVRERLMLFVSPHLMETLPALPAPDGGPVLPAAWLSSTPATAQAQRVELAIQGWPVDRTAAPPAGVDAAGLPPDALDLDDPLWMRDAIRRDAAGQWVRDASGAARIKWPFLTLWSDEDESFSPGAAYRLSGEPPWTATQHDPRSPEAGRFSGPYEACARLLAIECARGRPAATPAARAWWYAGWTQVAWLADPAEAARAVRAPLFAMNALGRAVDLAWPAALLFDAGPAGAAALLPGAPVLGAEREPVRLARAAAVAFLLRPALDPRRLRRMGYHDGQAVRGAVEALALRDGWPDRLYLEWEDSVEACAYLGAAGTWRARLGGREHDLPPGGWVIEAPNLFAGHLRVDGRRLWTVRTPDVWVWDAEPEAEWSGTRCAVPFVARALPDEAGWRFRWLTPPAGGERLRLRSPPGAVGVLARSSGGAVVPVARTGDMIDVRLPAGAREMELRWMIP